MEKKRQSNFEILRVLAMAMIVAMHYMVKGGIAVSMSDDGSPVNHVAWLIEAFCIVAANCYVLISGYFLVEAEWKLKKLVRLVAQVFFYALLIPVFCLLLGIGDVSGWSVYEWIFAVLPLQMEHYWFATSYVLLFMLVPVLAPGIRHLSKKQLQITIGVLMFYYCVIKSLSPILLSTDRYGYDLGWFICLFLIAGYIRLYGIPFFEKKRNSLLVYIICSLGIFTISALAGWICRKTGALKYYMDMPYCYNYILTLIGAVALFYVFKQMSVKEGKIGDLIAKIAPYTFGIYLIHENLAIRYLWPAVLGAEKVRGSLLFIPDMLLAIAVVFAVGIAVDFLRKKLFGLFPL
ncbi:MAG: acyltransferase [Lachnospiraceae bacterium]|nr:acyltransferase [Lachnospiraceae bacterium]